MSGEKKEVGGGLLSLTSEERVNGFSYMADDQHNITLLKCGKRVAWFSAAVSAEVLRGFLALISSPTRKKGGDAYRED